MSVYFILTDLFLCLENTQQEVDICVCFREMFQIYKIISEVISIRMLSLYLENNTPFNILI